MWHEIGLIWRKEDPSRWTFLHQTHVLTEAAWQQRSEQWGYCTSRSRALCVGTWPYLVAAIQQTLEYLLGEERNTGYCHSTGLMSKNTSLANTTAELGSGISRDIRLTGRAADAFSMPGRRQECCLGKWWVMAKAAKVIRMCKGKAEHREAYKSQGPRITLWAISRVAQPVWLSQLLNRRHLPPDVFVHEVLSNSGERKLISKDARPVAPTRKGRRKSSAYMFASLQLSYASQNAA